MYESFFGLTRRPFSSMAQPREYYPGPVIEAARQNLLRCVQRGEGTGLVVGPSGTGKTLLCQLLAEHFKDQFGVALLARGALGTRRALLQAILYELGQPYRGMDEGELRLALIDHVTLSDDCRHGIVLLVDEAHTLPMRLLDEIRTLTNVAAVGLPRIRLVLAGSSALEERLASPKLDSFSQRIVARCYLEAFNRQQTQEYIEAQIRSSGGDDRPVFSPEACQSVYRATDGVPRLINQLCDHALLLAYTGGRRAIDPACVEEAWADLQQLPSPWNGEPQAAPAGGGAIEFGGLDDQDVDDASTPARSEPLPMLRVAPEVEESVEPDALFAQPLEQLDRIEEALEGLDDDFQPAGSIGPEVELVFPDPGNPFSEPFEEEELVVERYGLPPRRPISRSAPSFDHQSDPWQFRPTLADLPVPAAAEQVEQEVEEEVHSAILEARPAGVALHEEPEDPAPEEPDLIVVEDDYDDTPAPPLRPVTPVRHNEYRRLFAKLRRG